MRHCYGLLIKDPLKGIGTIATSILLDGCKLDCYNYR